jgi:putative oxidoreductase
MADERRTAFQDFTLSALRIVVGILLFTHGAQKLLGWFGGSGPDGEPAELMTRFGIAGLLETIGGGLLVVGLFTRQVAFVLSGQLAVAYFWIHVSNAGPWWWENAGELAMLYAWVLLLFVAWGGGSLSLDAKRARE